MPKSTGKSAMIKTLESIVFDKSALISERLEAVRIWVSIHQTQPKLKEIKPKSKSKTKLLG